MGCGQSKHAAHSPVGGHGTLPQSTSQTYLTPAKTIPLDAEVVGAELADADMPAAPASPLMLLCAHSGAQKPACVQLHLVIFRPLAPAGRPREHAPRTKMPRATQEFDPLAVPSAGTSLDEERRNRARNNGGG